MSVTAANIAQVLGGRQTLGQRVVRMSQLEEIVREGLPKEALDKLIEDLTAAGFKESRPPLRYRIVPRATYQRNARLKLQAGETTERLARLYALLQGIFTDKEAAVRFLSSKHPELDNRTPFEAALTEIGGRQVEEIIERGRHGLPA